MQFYKKFKSTHSCAIWYILLETYSLICVHFYVIMIPVNRCALVCMETKVKTAICWIFNVFLCFPSLLKYTGSDETALEAGGLSRYNIWFSPPFILKCMYPVRTIPVQSYLSNGLFFWLDCYNFFCLYFTNFVINLHFQHLTMCTLVFLSSIIPIYLYSTYSYDKVGNNKDI